MPRTLRFKNRIFSLIRYEGGPMKRTVWISGSVLFAALSGCVSTGTFQKMQSQCSTDKQALTQKLDAVNLQLDTMSKEKTAIEEAARAKDEEISKLKGTYDDLVGNLKNEIANGQIQVTQLKDKLTVNMVEKILFNSGSAQVKPEGMKVLDRVADALKKVNDKAIRVEGYTDNVPLSPKLRDTWPTNWELSASRATTVVRYLQEKDGLDPSHLIAAGFSQYHPVSSNDTPEGRAQNRRIDIVLVPLDLPNPAANITPVPAVPAQAPVENSGSAPTAAPANSPPS